jgi:hypothetical protein
MNALLLGVFQVTQFCPGLRRTSFMFYCLVQKNINFLLGEGNKNLILFCDECVFQNQTL